MTPLDALQLLDNIVARVSMNREDHSRTSQAIQVLLAEINKNQIPVQTPESTTSTPVETTTLNS